MLLEDFQEWCKKKRKGKSNQQFNKFMRSEHWEYKTSYDLIGDLAWQLYQLQVCLEGIIQDMGDMHLSSERPSQVKYVKCK